MLPHMLNQLIIIRGDNDLSRREMVAYGGLEAVQSIVTQPATELHHLKNALLKGFPGEAVRLTTPGFVAKLLDNVEHFHPDPN